MTSRKISRPPARAALVKAAVAGLEDMKAVNIKVMDVRQVTDVADCMILASGNSDRHVRSIADHVVERAKAAGFRPIGTEGERDGEWALVDLNDVIVHVMLPRVRELYRLEELWEAVPARPKVKPRKAKIVVKRKAAPKGKKSAAKKSPGKASKPRAVAPRGKKSKTSSRARG